MKKLIIGAIGAVVGVGLMACLVKSKIDEDEERENGNLSNFLVFEVTNELGEKLYDSISQGKGNCNLSVPIPDYLAKDIPGYLGERRPEFNRVVKKWLYGIVKSYGYKEFEFNVFYMNNKPFFTASVA